MDDIERIDIPHVRDPKNFAFQMILPTGCGDPVLLAKILIHRLSIHAVRRGDYGEGVTGILFGEKRESRRLHTLPHRLRHARMPRKHIPQSLGPQHREDFF